MKEFFRFAKGMLRYRTKLICALVFAMLGAGGLGAGLLGAQPVLSAILSPPDKKIERKIAEWSAEQSGALSPSMVGSLADRLTSETSRARTLPQMATQLNTHINGAIPQAWIDQLPTSPYAAVLWIVLGLACVTIVASLANFLHEYLSMTIVTQTVADIREQVFRHTIHLPMKTLLSSGPTAQVTRIINDCGELSGGMNNLLNKAVGLSFKATVSMAAAFVIDWRLASIAIPTVIVLGFIIRKLGTRIRRAARGGMQARGGVLQTAGEVVENLRVVKTSTAESRESARFHDANRAWVKQDMRMRTAKAVSSPLVEAITLFALGGLCLIAAKAILDGHLEADSFITTMAALGIAGGCLKPLTGLSNELQVASAAATRVREVLNTPQEDGYQADRPALARHHATLEFDRITYTYPRGHQPALHEISLSIRHGETVAFVGPNGSGKTTLLSLVPRLLEPDEGQGRLLIDGVDISTVSLASLRGQIGVVTQDTVLFKGTVRSNLVYGVSSATEEQVREAARKARAEEFILSKPKGYEGEIGERGSGLSGGQRQRIAIARAILRDPAILILDEATSMIDADSEAKIAAALDEFSQGRTCLIIAHRLSTVIHADRIVVMDHGRIVDVGTHDVLMGRCATYRLIAEHQLVKAPPAAEVIGAE